MAERELWYAQFGPLIYEDTDTSFLPDGRAMRGAHCSQVYLTDSPVDIYEVPNRYYFEHQTRRRIWSRM